MIARGSLRECILFAFSYFHQWKPEMLAITCNPAGKYYSVATEICLAKAGERSSLTDARVVFHGTQRELEQFAKYCDQPTLLS